jgi:hypothetical protein
LIEEAIGLAGELAHPSATSMALSYKLHIECARNDPERVLADAENLLRISERHGMAFHAALSRVYLSWARVGWAMRAAALTNSAIRSLIMRVKAIERGYLRTWVFLRSSRLRRATLTEP